MNVQARYPTTADEFLRWNEGREGKREFVNGRVVEMMINVTKLHWRLVTRLTQQLIEPLGLDQYDIGSADFGVRTSDGVRYPDVMAEAFSEHGKVLATDCPLLVAEVLSDSTTANDFGPKARDYLAIRSLRHYLVLAQDNVKVWVWSRDANGNWAEPQIYTEESSKASLSGFGIELDLASPYAGVVRRPAN